jgi:hypothetical protein
LVLGYPALTIERDTPVDRRARRFLESLWLQGNEDGGIFTTDGRKLTKRGLDNLQASLDGITLRRALLAVEEVLFMLVKDGTLVLSSAKPKDLFTFVDGDAVCKHDVRARRPCESQLPRDPASSAGGSFGDFV